MHLLGEKMINIRLILNMLHGIGRYMSWIPSAYIGRIISLQAFNIL